MTASAALCLPGLTALGQQTLPSWAELSTWLVCCHGNDGMRLLKLNPRKHWSTCFDLYHLLWGWRGGQTWRTLQQSWAEICDELCSPANSLRQLASHLGKGSPCLSQTSRWLPPHCSPDCYLLRSSPELTYLKSFRVLNHRNCRW